MRILYVTPDIAWPLSFGGDIRKWNLLQGLLQAGDTDALVFVRDGRRVADEAFKGCGQVLSIDDVPMNPRDARRYQSTLGRGLLTLGHLLPYEYLGPRGPALWARLQKLVAFDSYDLVWFAGARRAVHVSDLARGATVLDGDDFEYVREYHLLRSQAWYGAKVWNYLNVAKLWAVERRFHRRFSAVVRCSPLDARRHPAANVIVIPNGTVVPPAVEWRPDRRVLFVGDLGYGPNRQGLEWFLESIWKLVRGLAPDARLDLVGRNEAWARARVHGHDGIEVHGFATDLTPFYRRAALSIAPLHAGGGTRLKILESLAHAVPVVSTRLGAFGIDVPPDHGLAVADEPADFAALCATLLSAAGSSVSPASRGRQFVSAHYDWQTVQQLVATAAKEIVEAAPERLRETPCASST